MDGVAPQQLDAAKDAESFDLSTMMDPWSTSLPLPQMLAILIQPPELTRQKIELFPPIVVRLLQPGDMPNVWAIATLLSNGVDVTDQLRGEPIRQGVYYIRMCLYRMDYDSCPNGVIQVGLVDSNAIIIGPRLDGIAIHRSIGDLTAAHDTLEIKQPLLYQTVDANACIDDHTGYFPNLTIHASSSVITMEQMGQIEYSKYMVFKPVSDSYWRLQIWNMDSTTSDMGCF
ncbi:hypothetical protein ACJ73_08159 [Blastomyces percursus]|uniref:Uncharacterized protein n=1 Tax=Blastomyces percursus TaxID=1658174 RepID=A0A1J9PX71_9EURO|nr:hypothetical protein ACJ73_08159 [Blastomyces percursus]